MKRKMIQKTVNGSFTMEAVFLFPILVFLILFLLLNAISLYEEADQAASDIKEVRQMDSLEIFLNESKLDIVKEAIFENE